jgi:ammonia channel protein AmtB
MPSSAVRQAVHEGRDAGDSWWPPSARAWCCPNTFASFQADLCRHHLALIVGGFAERIKFSAVLIFMVLWFTFSYIPMAHMVWYWAGPDAFTSAEAAAKAGEFAGFLFNKGALDFAGGTVVHINAGVAGWWVPTWWASASATARNPWPRTA